ncbi:C39 family peptidase [Allokutzneria sp. NRRL B-24872]|uniref:C39 family peptidase n=1 Tax=Allokutzneria sp. NRRL B-24872 TaxID=1137961 RepID=UPI0011780E15|nr:C39 family peptidase [Allokutzneria sp. NRRL B-24872]
MIRRRAAVVAAVSLAATVFAAPAHANATEKTLTHEWQGQQQTGWADAAALRVAVSPRVKPVPSQQKLHGLLGSPIVGDPGTRMRRAVNQALRTSWFELKPISGQLSRDVVLNINNNYPVIVHLADGWHPSGPRGGHHVTVVGYRSGGAEVLVADASAEGTGGPGWETVPRTRWLTAEALTSLVDNYIS